MLEVNNLHKHGEEDSFKEGCLPETSFSFNVDISFKAETQEELIQKICDFLGIDNEKENYLINSCDEKGRIDFQLLEDRESVLASKLDIKRWKQGSMKLYYVCYSAYVEEVTRAEATLTV